MIPPQKARSRLTINPPWYLRPRLPLPRLLRLWKNSALSRHTCTPAAACCAAAASCKASAAVATEPLCRLPWVRHMPEVRVVLPHCVWAAAPAHTLSCVLAGAKKRCKRRGVRCRGAGQGINTGQHPWGDYSCVCSSSAGCEWACPWLWRGSCACWCASPPSALSVQYRSGEAQLAHSSCSVECAI